LFKLEVTSAQIADRYQTVLGKDGRPVEGLPFQPFVVVVGGKDDQFMSRDCLSVNLLDRSGRYRCAASRAALQPQQWYAFAAVCDGSSLRLYLNRFDGRGYQLEAETEVEGGLIRSTGTWTIGRGMFDGSPNSWLQGFADEIRITREPLAPEHWLTAQTRSLPDPPPAPRPQVQAPTLCVPNLADPEVLLHDGTYYLYGTGDTRGFDVWKSSDLRSWEKASRAIEAGDGVWGDSAFWAPAVVERNEKFYLFYSASGPLPVDGGRRSVRMGVAVAERPEGPFREVVPRMPLLGRAVIDPDVFIDTDGTPYLYFVADINENNGAGQIYVVRLRDDLLGTVGEPVACISPSQPWEGTVWNEAPLVLKVKDQYVLMYSANFWASHDYAVGYATAPTPMGPWDKYDENPIFRRHAGLLGTGHNSIASHPDGSLLTFFHAHRDERNAQRDTYVAALQVDYSPGMKHPILRPEPQK
jgi:GH43 family beta-xylosidase